MIKKVLLFISLAFITYSSESSLQNSGSFFKEYAKQISTSKSLYQAGDTADIDGDGNIEGIMYSIDRQGSIKSAFILRCTGNSCQSLGSLSNYDKFKEYKYISSEFKSSSNNNIKFIVSYFKNRENIVTEVIFELKTDGLKVISFHNNTTNRKNSIVNDKIILSDEDIFINSLNEYRYYTGSINFKRNRDKYIEVKRDISYKNRYNLFLHPETSNETLEFFIESVILGVPRDISQLSANRNMLNKSILNSIAVLKNKTNPYNLLKYKEVYNVRGKLIYQLEFDFNLNRKVSVYFVTLNNIYGKWLVESISIEKPFLTSR